MAYEDYISELEESTFPSAKAMEAGADALAFVVSLNNVLRENGANLPEEPDVDQLGTVLDGVFGELAAVCIFLSEKSFARVPKMLRTIADALEKADESFKDPSGQTGTSVPSAVIRGYRDLATRLEATRVQKAELFDELRKFKQSQESA